MTWREVSLFTHYYFTFMIKKCTLVYCHWCHKNIHSFGAFIQLLWETKTSCETSSLLLHHSASSNSHHSVWWTELSSADFLRALSHFILHSPGCRLHRPGWRTQRLRHVLLFKATFILLLNSPVGTNKVFLNWIGQRENHKPGEKQDGCVFEFLSYMHGPDGAVHSVITLK